MNFLRRLTTARSRQEGFSMIELILAMALSSLVVILSFTIFRTAATLQGDSTVTLQSDSAAQNASALITKQVRTASAFRVTSATRIDIRTPTGTCQAWYVSGTTLYYKASSTAIPATPSTPTRKLTNLSQITSTNYFTARNSGVQYAWYTGTGMGKLQILGQANTRVVGATTSPCW